MKQISTHLPKNVAKMSLFLLHIVAVIPQSQLFRIPRPFYRETLGSCMTQHRYEAFKRENTMIDDTYFSQVTFWYREWLLAEDAQCF